MLDVNSYNKCLAAETCTHFPWKLHTSGTIIYDEIYLRTSLFIYSISLMLMPPVAVAVHYCYAADDDNDVDAWPRRFVETCNFN